MYAKFVNVPGCGFDDATLRKNQCVECDGSAVVEGAPQCCGYFIPNDDDDEDRQCCGNFEAGYDDCGECNGTGERVDASFTFHPRNRRDAVTKKKVDDVLPTAMNAKWNAAADEPGALVDLGDLVVCDICMVDYRGRNESGGFIVQSTAVCPHCAGRYMTALRKYRETHLIRATCAPRQTFQQFVLDYRRARGSNSITIFTGETAEQVMGLTPETKS